MIYRGNCICWFRPRIHGRLDRLDRPLSRLTLWANVVTEWHFMRDATGPMMNVDLREVCNGIQKWGTRFLTV